MTDRNGNHILVQTLMTSENEMVPQELRFAIHFYFLFYGVMTELGLLWLLQFVHNATTQKLKYSWFNCLEADLCYLRIEFIFGSIDNCLES